MSRALPWIAALAAASIAGVAWGRPARQRWSPAAAREHRAAVKRWHSAEGLRPVLDASSRPKLVLEALNTGERAELEAQTDDGGFDRDALLRASTLLRDTRSGETHAIEPRALDLVYRAMRHFSAPLVRVVSGFRAPRGSGGSNHGKGRAIDLVLPGVADTKLSEWARSQGFTGVGVYPNSGFCHLDVRSQSYFWVDTSGPGQRSREAPVRRAEAARADARARARGVEPPSFSPARGDTAAAIGGKPATPAADDADDHADEE